MSDMTIKKEKPKYSTCQNIVYLIKNMWKWDKVLFLSGAIQIPITVIIPLLGIYLPKVLIDSITAKESVNEFLISIGVPIIGMVFSTILLATLSTITGTRKSGYRLSYMIHQVDKTVDTDFENIDGPQGQEKLMKAGMTILNNNSATEVIVDTIIEFFSSIIGFILYSSIISTIHPLIVVLIIASSIINYFVGKYVNNYEYKNRDNLAPIERKLKYIRENTGNFKSAKDMRLYNMSKWFKDMYKILIKERVYFQKKDIYKRYLASFVDGILILIRDGLTYGFLIYSVIYRDMAVGNFVLYFAAVGGFSTWLSGIVKSINTLNSVGLSTCDLRAYLEMKDKMNRGEGVELPKTDELPCDIELRNLYYKYPGAEDYVIKNMNLYIRKGEKLAVVGVNGAGKTTLIKLICGLYTPTKGEIYINGKQSNLYNRDEYYTLFSVVFQEIHQLPISIEKTITSQLKDEIDYKKLDNVINMSGFDSKMNSLPKGKETLLVKSVNEGAIDLSGGEMQKLILARALYKDGPIVILDEPTAALDPIAEFEIYKRYNDLTKQKTSIFISHRLSSTRFCDRIVFLEDGNILEEGNHYDLMKKGGKYSKMYDMQSHYYKEDLGGEKYEE